MGTYGKPYLCRILAYGFVQKFEPLVKTNPQFLTVNWCFNEGEFLNKTGIIAHRPPPPFGETSYEGHMTYGVALLLLADLVGAVPKLIRKILLVSNLCPQEPRGIFSIRFCSKILPR